MTRTSRFILPGLRVLRICAAYGLLAYTATASADLLSCYNANRMPPTLTETFEFCVHKTSSLTRDNIMPNAPQSDCPMTVGGTARQWVKIKVKSDGKAFNPATKHQVRKAIIVVHGGGEAPGELFNAVTKDMDNPANYWLVGPQFLDYGQLDAEPDVLNWECPNLPGDPDNDAVGRNVGDASVHPPGVQVSSFDLLDNLVRKMKAQSTAQEIVIIGHSAGGRLVGRYAMATQIEAEIGIPVRYIIASPSTNAFVGPDRYTYHTTGTRFRPKTIDTACDGIGTDTELYYDAYPYGLAGLEQRTAADHYVHGTRDELKNRLRNKPRLYIVGGQDNAFGDNTCASFQQGTSRVVANRTHWHHLKTVGAAYNANFCVVRNVAHDGNLVVGSPMAEQYWEQGNVEGFGNCEIGPLPPGQ